MAVPRPTRVLLRWLTAVGADLLIFAGFWWAWEALHLPPAGSDRLAVALGVAAAVSAAAAGPLFSWAGRQRSGQGPGGRPPALESEPELLASQITVYLKTLIDWLNSDPWLLDRRLGGPLLRSAAIECMMRVTVVGRESERDLDAETLAQQCRRLVILGGPGSGKTWLAKRSARRAAEIALAALARGGNVDEVELPLYTSCQRLFAAAGDIREAIVSSAFGQLGDLGGSRITAALHTFFTERNAPTLLVIDALDEAQGDYDRLRQADTLPWRIMLTSRPGSWNQQLLIEDDNESGRLAYLQPLQYPSDIESFIRDWFDSRPELGTDLAAQIARRPSLQQAATIPLILVFYCIIGGVTPLPEHRRDLYTKVINRLLTGLWHGDADHTADAEVCLKMLRAWAWAGAISIPVSGIGAWVDDIPTQRVQLGSVNEKALDHIATAVGPPDVDTGIVLRRFIHRTIREHLVAEHVARLPLEQAAQALLPHLWYDPNWEYSAPAAIAMHCQNDRLLRDLIGRAASSDQLPADLSIIDAHWQFRTLLARVASESSETAWSPELATAIGRARIELAKSSCVHNLGEAAGWEISNRHSREALVELFADKNDGPTAEVLVTGIVQLVGTTQDARDARETLLQLLVGQTDPWITETLVQGVVQLAGTADGKRQAREALLELLTDQTESQPAARSAYGLSRMDPAIRDLPDDLRRIVSDSVGFATAGGAAAALAEGIVALDPTTENKCRTHEALLKLLAEPSVHFSIRWLSSILLQVAATPQEKREVRCVLLSRLAGETGQEVLWVADALKKFDPTAEDEHRASELLFKLLAREGDFHIAEGLLECIARFVRTTREERYIRKVLLKLLASQTDALVAAKLANGLIRLNPEKNERRIRKALLKLLFHEPIGWEAGELAITVAQLHPTAKEMQQARDSLLRTLTSTQDGITEVLAGLAQFNPTMADESRAREELLRRLTSEDGSRVIRELARGLVQLATDEYTRRQARGTLLGRLTCETDVQMVTELAEAIAQLMPSKSDAHRVREVLFRWLNDETDSPFAKEMINDITRLCTVTDDKYQARSLLLSLLVRGTSGLTAGALASGLVQLDPTAEDRRDARKALLQLLNDETDHRTAEQLVKDIIQLDPTISDISTWSTWATSPTDELLAATRRNSTLDMWLMALPSLSRLSGPAA